ncbi:homoserine kinase [Arthrobacter stackebrandtii]|uniref:Homoserine kinase n=1 Tax=Arthrobacter stackebrandtii TaxID=272161 RepID=A0ABS4Z0V7_9MICC|nr:homoserine kinase [Arthrobacter stackebrandtii]MBP2413878.1 homoserine kinase [Arthrobacter stackebrandtii]
MTAPLLKTPSAGAAATVRVPGTSANLGPGFDSLGLAVSLYDTLTVTALDVPQLEFELSGEGVAELPRDASHLVVKTMDLAWARLGYARVGLRIAADNVLPHGRGLGSSASAIVAAVMAANALVAPEDRQDSSWVLQLASELEGHPDNVAPAIFGAVAISWEEGGRYASARLAPSEQVIPVVAIPDVELKTERARGMLPAAVPHADAAANSGRAALLMHALTAEPSLLLAGTRDYLHQDYRAEAMPGSAALVTQLRAEGFAAFISGAGPTVMVLANGAAAADAAVARITEWGSGTESAENSGVSWRVSRLQVDREGAKVEVHP